MVLNEAREIANTNTSIIGRLIPIKDVTLTFSSLICAVFPQIVCELFGREYPFWKLRCMKKGRMTYIFEFICTVIMLQKQFLYVRYQNIHGAPNVNSFVC